MVFVLLLCPQYMVYQRIVPAPRTFLWTALVGCAVAAIIIFTVRRFGVRRLRAITVVPLVGVLFFLLGANGRLLDLNYSARPLARHIQDAAPDVAVIAAQDVRRDLDYGLAFYRNQHILHYRDDGVPDEEHILVIPTHEADHLNSLLPGRVYQQLFLYPTQGLSVYRVLPRS